MLRLCHGRGTNESKTPVYEKNQRFLPSLRVRVYKYEFRKLPSMWQQNWELKQRRRRRQRQREREICLEGEFEISRNSVRKLINPFSLPNMTKGKFDKKTKFHFVKFLKQITPHESTFKKISFEWSHHRILSTDVKVRPGSDAVLFMSRT